jgi:dipeptidase E
MGGNSFVLRRAMRLSGFDKLIGNFVNDNSLVYGGFSAGAVVATKTLRGIDLVDDPNSLPEDYPQNVVWEGLGFVDFSIAPHYRSDHPESESIENVVEYFQASNMPYKALRDGEVLVVRDENVLLLA